MASVLIVTADPESSRRITSLEAGLRYREVVSIESSQNWIAMQHFDVVLIDSRYGESSFLPLLHDVWKSNPFAIAGIFNLYDEIVEQWVARFIGARVFSGVTALKSIEQLFKNLPALDPLSGEYGVLLVEDLDSPREIIASFIEALGYTLVKGVDSVSAAIEELRLHPNLYFAVVTDMQMPNASGSELIREIRRDDVLAHLPVIVLTAYSTGENLLECIQAGATGFLVKPPNKKALKRELEKARRIFITKQPPRLCRPEDAPLLEDAVHRLSFR